MARVASPNPGNRPDKAHDPLLSYEQCAERLGTTRRFPKRLAEERRVKSVKVGRDRKIRESELEAWIEANTTSAVS